MTVRQPNLQVTTFVQSVITPITIVDQQMTLFTIY